MAGLIRRYWVCATVYALGIAVAWWLLPDFPKAGVWIPDGPNSILGRSADGRLLATGRMVDTSAPEVPVSADPGPHWPAELWDISQGRKVAALDGGKATGRIWTVRFSPDNTLAVVHADQFSLWSVKDGRRIASLSKFNGPISEPIPQGGGPAFSPSGTHLAGIVTEGDPKDPSHFMELWQLNPPRRTARIPCSWVKGAGFIRDGEQLVITSPEWEEARFAVHDVTTGKPIRTLPGAVRRPLCLAISPNGRFLAVGTNLQEGDPPGHSLVALWDLSSDKPPRVSRILNDSPGDYLSKDKTLVHNCRFLTDRYLWTGHNPGRGARLWDCSRSPLEQLLFQRDENHPVIVSPDDKWMLSGQISEVKGVRTEFSSFWSNEIVLSELPEIRKKASWSFGERTYPSTAGFDADGNALIRVHGGMQAYNAVSGRREWTLRPAFDAIGSVTRDRRAAVSGSLFSRYSGWFELPPHRPWWLILLIPLAPALLVLGLPVLVRRRPRSPAAPATLGENADIQPPAS